MSGSAALKLGAEASTPTGVDLDNPEVYALFERLFRARIAPQARAGSLDTDDLFQDLLLRIHVANGGRNPYDPSRSTLSSYLFVSMTCGLRNAIDRQRRAERRGWVCGTEQDVALDVRAVAQGADPMEDTWNAKTHQRKRRRGARSRGPLPRLPRMRQ